MAWALFAGSNDYTYKKLVGVEYINIPDNKAFHSLQADTVLVSVEASGWQLLFSNLRKENKTLQVDLSGLRTRNFVLFTNQLGFVNRQFPSDQRVISVSPDTLFFDFSKQTERKVPIKPVYDIRYKQQYGIIDRVTTDPEYVTVTGPLEDVVRIEYWETDTIRATGVDKDIQAVANLSQKQQANINFYPKIVDVNIPVGEVTEKILEVPVKVENAGRFNAVRLLPSRVRLTVMVSLRDYSRITSNSFEAVVNLEDWIEKNVHTLPVIITQVPDFCELVKVEPQNLNFFVRK